MDIVLLFSAKVIKCIDKDVNGATCVEFRQMEIDKSPLPLSPLISWGYELDYSANVSSNMYFFLII